MAFGILDRKKEWILDWLLNLKQPMHDALWRLERYHDTPTIWMHKNGVFHIGLFIQMFGLRFETRQLLSEKAKALEEGDRNHLLAICVHMLANDLLTHWSADEVHALYIEATNFCSAKPNHQEEPLGNNVADYLRAWLVHLQKT